VLGGTILANSRSKHIFEQNSDFFPHPVSGPKTNIQMFGYPPTALMGTAIKQTCVCCARQVDDIFLMFCCILFQVYPYEQLKEEKTKTLPGVDPHALEVCSVISILILSFCPVI
jgi:hypothetical protein